MTNLRTEKYEAVLPFAAVSLYFHSDYRSLPRKERKNNIYSDLSLQRKKQVERSYERRIPKSYGFYLIRCKFGITICCKANVLSVSNKWHNPAEHWLSYAKKFFNQIILDKVRYSLFVFFSSRKSYMVITHVKFPDDNIYFIYYT